MKKSFLLLLLCVLSPACGVEHQLGSDTAGGASLNGPPSCTEPTPGGSQGGGTGSYPFECSHWLKRAEAPPPARAFAAAAFDPVRNQVVLFGGAAQGALLGDTWEWDETSWTARTPASGPSARRGAAMVYDSKRQRTVLFGGETGAGVVAETWEWDGQAWAERALATQPPARVFHAMAYDSARERVVLFGGGQPSAGGPSTLLGDTWEFDGATWVQAAPSASPSPRAAHALAYDRKRGRVVLAFGVNEANQILNDGWEWDGTQWTPEPGFPSYGGVAWGAMSFDPLSAQVLLTGGFEDVGGAGIDYVGNGVASWNGSGFIQRRNTPKAPNPPAGFGHVMTESRRGVLLLSGLTLSGCGLAAPPCLRGEAWELVAGAP